MHAHSANSQTTSQTAGVTLDAIVVSRLKHSGSNIALSGGLCLPKGRLFELAALQVQVQGRPGTIPGQADVLNRWSDGSIRWLMASCELPHLPAVPRDPLAANQAAADVAWPNQQQIPLSITTSSAALSSDALTTVRHHQGHLRVACRSESESGPREQTLQLRILVDDENGNTLPLTVDSILQQVQGPVRRVFVVQARLTAQPFVTVQIRITHWVQSNALQVETRLRNSRRAKHTGGLWDLGDPGSFLMSGLTLQIESDVVGTRPRMIWKAEQAHAWQQTTLEDGVQITQYGSGGPSWNSDNHLGSRGTVLPIRQGYEVHSGSRSHGGNRAEPVVALTSDDGGFAVGVPEFWQQFPGSLSTSRGCTRVGLLASGVQREPFELQGGEQKTRAVWIQLLSAALPADTSDLQLLSSAFDSPVLIQRAAAYREANVFPWFPGDPPRSAALPIGSDQQVEASTPRNCGSVIYEDDIGRQRSYLQQATTGACSLTARRDRIDEYGWRNFGDIPADHEQTHYQGTDPVVSHYNNQFDLIYGAILQLAETGDLKWRDLLDPLARHVMDIDVYHTDQDRPAFNGGMFWHTDHYVHAGTSTHRTYSRRNQQAGRPYGGGPGCEHNYTTGLLHYYFLTGHAEARDTVLSLAEWVIRMDDGRHTVFGLLDDGPTGNASATVFQDFHGPGRGAGNSVNALLDAWILTSSDRFLLKAEELICRCVHPDQDLDSLHLDDAEGHWSYTVFLTALSRYLLIKREADQLDAKYDYARATMSHYGRWMLATEKPTLSQPQMLQYPTEAWAAQDFRKANVLRLAAACEDEPRIAAAMRSRARDLNNAAWRDLYAFGDSHRNARCLAILMTEGQRDVFHRTCEAAVIPPADTTWQTDQHLPSEWQMFVPQRQRVRQLLRSPRGLLRSALRTLNPGRWPRTFTALRRQLG